MNLIINGKPEQLPDGITAAQLIEQLGLADQRLAMEVNREIVPRSAFPRYTFKPGDQIEVFERIEVARVI